jgi:tRNA pseudouridine55 synthase
MEHKHSDSLYGVLLIDKPAGWTSHDVCNFVKRRFHIAKVGHTGTLDPQATGVLVILLGKYTKLSARFTNCDKEYRGTIELGATTTTQDGEGSVIERREWGHVTEEEVVKTVERFKGPQKQIPPMVSAIRSQGVRLYTIARKGIEIERKARDIVIYDIRCDKIYLPSIDFTVVSSKGTYVRTVAHDIGQSLGTGAYLKSLCRTRTGIFRHSDCVSIETLKKLASKDELLPLIRKDAFTDVGSPLE